jgi:hypothetical protein
MKVLVLILQPIVENAVKYGVAKSRKPVTVRIPLMRKPVGFTSVKDDGARRRGPASARRHRRRPEERLRPPVARYGNAAAASMAPIPTAAIPSTFMPVMRNG